MRCKTRLLLSWLGLWWAPLACVTAASTAAPPATSLAPARPSTVALEHLVAHMPADAVGWLNADLVKEVIAAHLVDHLKIAVNASGEMHELSIYHTDPSPIPKAVKHRVADELPNSHIKRYETEWLLGYGQTFEIVVLTAEGRQCEVKALPDGTPLLMKCVMTAAEIPPAVLQAAQRTLPDAALQSVAYAEASGKTVFVIEMKMGLALHKLELDKTGTVQKHSLKLPAVLEAELPLDAPPIPPAAPAAPPT